MPTRNARYWRIFLRNLLCPPNSPATSYDGLCVFTLSGRVEYRDGCFQSSVDVDPLQFLAIFDQLTRQAIRPEGNEQPPTSALRLGHWVVHIVSATFSSICAVSSGKTRGLVVEKLPFGVLVVAFSTPLQLETVFSRVDGACATLRC